MRNSSHCSPQRAVTCCAVCGGKLGMIRHYYWRNALCSKRCIDRFSARREADRKWFAGSDWLNASQRIRIPDRL